MIVTDSHRWSLIFALRLLLPNIGFLLRVKWIVHPSDSEGGQVLAHTSVHFIYDY